MRKVKPTDFSYALSEYLFDFLPVKKGLSQNTINSYSDTIELFLQYMEEQHGIRREKLEIHHLSREVAEEYLDWLETERHNSISTRNQRRVAINGFFKYLQYRNPGFVLLCQQILSIPKKTGPKRAVHHLSREAIEEILKQPDLATRAGKRDFVLLMLLYESAARVSEIADLRIGDFQSDRYHGAVIRLHGKGRKIRTVPLIKRAAGFVQRYISEEEKFRSCGKEDPLFCNRSGRKLTRAGIAYILEKYANMARAALPSIADANIHPHVLRHSRAVHWLEAGVDLQHIKHLLGHADLETTEVYAKINVALKREMLEDLHQQTCDPPTNRSWTSDHNLMTWLSDLSRN